MVTPEQRAEFVRLAKVGFADLKPTGGTFLDDMGAPTAACAWGAAAYAARPDKTTARVRSLYPDFLGELSTSYENGVVYGFERSPIFDDRDGDVVAGYADGIALRMHAIELHGEFR